MLMRKKKKVLKHLKRKAELALPCAVLPVKTDIGIRQALLMLYTDKK